MQKTRPFNYVQRLVLTFIGIVAIGLTMSQTFGLPLFGAMLIATPICLMLGSMFMLFHFAKVGAAVDAKKQIVTLLIVEFLLVPTGAAAALVAFFVLRAANPPVDAVPNWTPQPSASSTPR